MKIECKTSVKLVIHINAKTSIEDSHKIEHI